jgi:hypothetical protein
MRGLAVLFLHLLATVARLAGPGGARAVVAESVLVKQQRLILWLANSQSCRKDARTNSRAVTRVGTAGGPNPCCAFHAGSTTDGAHGAARSVDTHRDL